MNSKTLVAISLGLLCCIGIQTHGTSSDELLKIRAIYPKGNEVSPYQRITIEFDQKVVALGASMFVEDEMPIDIEPALDCEWNWVKQDTLRCELPGDTNLSGSTKYKVTVRPGLKTLADRVMDTEYVHFFQTILPAIYSSNLVSWASPTRPIVEVSFNQELDLNSLMDRIFFYDADTGEEIPSIVRRSDWNYSFALKRDYFGRAGTYQHSIRGTRGNRTFGIPRTEVIVRPRNSLSPGADVSLLMLPGVEGSKGNLKTTERLLVDTDITTFEEFRLLGLRCKDISGQEIFAKIDQPNPTACDVHSDIRLVFSSRFADGGIENYVHVQPPVDIASLPGMLRGSWNKEPEGFGYSLLGEFRSSTTYRLYISRDQEIGDGSKKVTPVEDGFGRQLIGKNEVTFRTGPPAPRAHLNEINVTVDSRGAVEPQIVLGNIDDVNIVYDVLDEVGYRQNQSQKKQSPKQDDVEQAQSLGLRDVLRSSTGVMIGNIDGLPRFNHPKAQTKDYFFAQATPYSVFLKLGTTASLVWVVDFQTGEPVANASVEFYMGTANDLSENRESVHSGNTDTDGFVSLPGYESFDPHWNRVVDDINSACPDDSECSMYFLRINGKAGMSLLPLDADFVLHGSEAESSIYQNIDHWTTTSQMLYRPSDTVQIKGYVRSVRNEVRIIPSTGHYALCVTGAGARKYEITPITLNQFGAYHASLELSSRTELGDYEINLVYHPSQPITEPCSREINSSGVYTSSGGSFKVYEFKTNPIRVTQALNATSYERGDSMTITSSAELHAGGPYAHAKGQLDIFLLPEPAPFKIVDTSQFIFRTSNDSIRQYGRQYGTAVELDDGGSHTFTIDSLDNDVYYGSFWITTSVISDRGKSVASRTSVPYFGVDQFVGINVQREESNSMYSDRWVHVNKPWPIEVIVLSKDDKIVSGTDIHITVFESQLSTDELDQTSRSTSNIKWNEFFNCTLVSDQSPVSCDFIPQKENYYRINAQIEDSKGNTHNTSIRLKARVDKTPRLQLAQPTDDVNLELKCDSFVVKVGDVVRCRVENHLGSSPALVTIERSAVIDQWLVRLDPTNPVVEFTVLEDYAPHFELSMLSLSPMDAKNSTSGNSYRIANEKFTLNNPQLESMPVSISTNHKSYKPGDQVELAVSASVGEDSTIPLEYAIAVVDESLLDLSGATDTDFDPTTKVWRLRASGLRTYGLVALLMEESDVLPLTPEPYWDRSLGEEILVTGNSIYRSMAVEFDQDQSLDPSVREINKFVAYWNPSVVSSHGTEILTFDLPDNLTSWKVLVMAISAKDQFGFATTTFSTIKDTEIRAVAPNVVTEGDSFQVGASIFNRAEGARTLTVELQASGLLDKESKTEYRKKLEFKPFERKVVSWEVRAGSRPPNFQEVSRFSEIRIVASAGDRQDKDALDIRIPVRSNRVRVSSVVYGAIADDTTTIPIEVPEKVATEDGQLDFTLTTNEEVNFDGVFRYAIEYPYTCWEQKLTQAIIAMQYLELKKRGVQHGIEWSDPKSMIVRTLDSVIDFQAPNGGMAYFVPRNRNTDAYLSAYTAIAFSWLENAGYEIPQKVKRNLLNYLRDFLTNQEKEPEITNRSATIGAAVLHALAILGELDEIDLTQYSDHLNQLDLFGLSQYLLASVTLNSNHPLNVKIFERIMNHRSLVDGVVEFVESVPYSYASLLHSDTRSRCAVLNALTNYAKVASSSIDISELKELSNSVRHARENSPCWLSSQDNVFCINALVVFADYVESDVRDLTATIDLRSADTGISTRLANAWKFNTEITRLHTLHPIQAKKFGSEGSLEINRVGNGSAFYSVELAYLTNADDKINRFSGFEIHREYFVLRGNQQWELLKPGSHVNKGEHVLVNLFLNNRFTRFHVVLDDSVPGGLEPVNKHLETEYTPYHSPSDLEEILSTSRWYRNFQNSRARFSSFHSELGLQNVRFYSKFLSRGKHHLTWLGQAISAGEFSVLPTHVEEMYRPLVFGKSEPWTLKVKP